MQGYIYSTESIRHEYINDNGNNVVAYEQVPRGLVPLNQKEWEVIEYLVKMLKPMVGKRVYQVNDTTFARDLFFAGVQGPKRPGSDKNWSYLKVGQMFSKFKQDEETGDAEYVYWFSLFRMPTQDTPEAPQAPQNDAGEEVDTQAVSEDVESI